jgi:tetratricopeptide (TPR) repeat protein
MRSVSTRARDALVVLSTLWGLWGVAGCTELRGRRAVREGNRLHREGRYREALAAYREAEGLVPDLWILWLNEGLTCRQIMIPGLKTPDNDAAIACALKAFDTLKRLRPADARGEQLYVQTLFDADRFETLAAMYGARLRKNPSDVEAVNGLVQVYSRWNRWDDAIRWYVRKADLQPRDPEAQYAVGVYAWQQLFQRGGAQDKASFDPRPDPNAKKKEVKIPPPFSIGDVVGAQRIWLADLGIRYLERAVSLRPKYSAAMTYLNLLYRQKSFGYFSEPDKWQECIDAAERWRRQAQSAQEKAGPAAARPSLPSPAPPGVVPGGPAGNLHRN